MDIQTLLEFLKKLQTKESNGQFTTITFYSDGSGNLNLPYWDFQTTFDNEKELFEELFNALKKFSN